MDLFSFLLSFANQVCPTTRYHFHTFTFSPQLPLCGRFVLFSTVRVVGFFGSFVIALIHFVKKRRSPDTTLTVVITAFLSFAHYPLPTLLSLSLTR